MVDLTKQMKVIGCRDIHPKHICITVMSEIMESELIQDTHLGKDITKIVRRYLAQLNSAPSIFW